MNRRPLFVVALALFGAFIVISGALFTVRQSEQVVLLQLGEPVRVIQEPGLKVKIPFIQNTVYFDRRLLQYDAQVEEVILLDQKRLVVDSFVIYRITDPLKFFQTVGSEQGVRNRIGSVVSGSLRRILGGVPLSTMLSAERETIMEGIRTQVNEEGKRFGIEVVDVRIRRADLPDENSQAIYARMQSERQREANEARAQGAELAQGIRSRADRERTVILAEAEKQSQILRGDGDGEAVRIYVDAYGQDKDFAAFYRTMQAYRTSFDEDTSLVLSPDGDFFRFFNDSKGAKRR